MKFCKVLSVRRRQALGMRLTCCQQVSLHADALLGGAPTIQEGACTRLLQVSAGALNGSWPKFPHNRAGRLRNRFTNIDRLL